MDKNSGDHIIIHGGVTDHRRCLFYIPMISSGVKHTIVEGMNRVTKAKSETLVL